MPSVLRTNSNASQTTKLYAFAGPRMPTAAITLSTFSSTCVTALMDLPQTESSVLVALLLAFICHSCSPASQNCARVRNTICLPWNLWPSPDRDSWPSEAAYQVFPSSSELIEMAMTSPSTPVAVSYTHLTLPTTIEV